MKFLSSSGQSIDEDRQLHSKFLTGLTVTYATQLQDLVHCFGQDDAGHIGKEGHSALGLGPEFGFCPPLSDTVTNHSFLPLPRQSFLWTSITVASPVLSS